MKFKPISIRKLLSLSLGAILMVSLFVGPALAESGTLPGGTAIEVVNEEPVDGETYNIPVGTTLDMDDEGRANIAEGVADPDTLLVYVFDVSGSTDQEGTGCGEDLNGDGKSNTILDCEIAAALALNDKAVTEGSVGEVGVAVYANTGDEADVGPAGGEQWRTGPDTDANSANGRDIEEVFKSAYSDVLGGDGGVTLFTNKAVGQWTSFGAGLAAAVNVVNASSLSNRIIVFMSDGLNNTGPDVSTITVPGDVTIYTFAIGEDSSCSDDPDGYGSLNEVAGMGSGEGTCTHVENVSDLPEVIPSVIGSELTSLTIEIDGGVEVPISNDDIDPDLPVTGPGEVTYGTPISLGPGEHEICVTAYGSDAGGEGSITDCKTITVVQVVPIDIKPQSCPNPINMKDKGVLPVAILGTGVFDVTTVDPVTVVLTMDGLGGPSVEPLRWALEDVATPYTADWAGSCYACTEAGPDGCLDLTLKFKAQEVIETLGLEDKFGDGDCVILKLAGDLKDGTPWCGEDVVRIILKNGGG